MSTSLSKGTVSLSVATLFFFAVGYVVQILIGRFVDPVTYGSFGVVLYLLNTTEYVFAAGLSQSVSKFLAERPSAGKSIVRLSGWAQVIIALAFMILLAALAPAFGHWYNDDSITSLVWIVVLIIPFYSARSFVQGILGGQREFSAQAKVKVLIALAKFAFALAALLLGAELMGVLVAYLLAAAFGAIYGRWFVKPLQAQTHVQPKEFFVYTGSLTAFLVIFPLFINIDVFLVKGLVESDLAAGWYVSATTLARLPFYLFTGLLLTLLPSVAHLKETSREELNRVVAEVIRYALLLLFPIAAIVSVTSSTLLPLVFGAEYQGGADALRILIIGISILVLFRVFSTILLGITKPNAVIGITAAMIVLDIALNIALIPTYGIVGAATATLIASGVGLVIIAIKLWKHMSLTLSFRTIINILIATGAAGFLSSFAHTGWVFVAELVGLGIVYLAILWLLGEVQNKDLDRVARLFKRNSHEEAL